MHNFHLIPHAHAVSVTQKASETGATSGQAVEQFFDLLWDKVDNWIAAIIVMILAVFVAKMIRTAAVDRISEHLDEEHQDVMQLTGRATYLAVLAVGVTIALKIAGIDITAIMAAFGFGIGFAMQDLIMNFIAGVMIIISRQFRIDDFIMINGTLGQVKEIQSRSTILQQLDGTKVIVPNRELFSSQIISYTTNPFRRIDVPVGVEYSTDLKQAVDVAMKTLHEHNLILKEPKPSVILDQFADSSINLIVRFWVESKSNWLGIRSEIIMNLKRNFDIAGINIPFPIRTIYMAKEEQDISHAMEDAGMVPKMDNQNQLIAEAVGANGQTVKNSINTAPDTPKDKPKKAIIDDVGAAFLGQIEGK